jgi:maleamate amidohydrolase
MAIWDDVLTARDKEIMNKAGYGERIGFGASPAVLVIDMTYNFVGDRPEPILKSIERFRQSCGEEGWTAISKIRDLLAIARQKNLPIFYTRALEKNSKAAPNTAHGKNRRAKDDFAEGWQFGNQIVEELAPHDEDVIVEKPNRSAFFGTSLMSMLNERHIDTVLLTGCTTSGCVRATALDAFAFKFKVAVVEECVFDRIQISHKVSLFDLSMKYADIVSDDEARQYIAGL